MTNLHYSNDQSRTNCARVCCTKIKNFSAKIGSNIIFEDVNLHIHCGQLTALIGPNGAGKSTLLKCILNQFPHQGSLEYMDAKNKHTGNPVIGYVPQYLNFDRSAPISVRDFFSASLSYRPVFWGKNKQLEDKIVHSLRRVQAEYLIDKRLGGLSGGEMQRLLLALALNPMPDLLLLDEPISGVDHNGLKLFYQIIDKLRQEEDMAIVLVSHDLPLVRQYSDQVILLNKKVLCAGDVDTVFMNPLMQQLFGLIYSPIHTTTDSNKLPVNHEIVVNGKVDAHD